MKKYIFNPTFSKSPLGVQLSGSTIKYSIKVAKFTGVYAVNFLLHRDGEYPKVYPMDLVFADDRYFYYEIAHTYDESGHYWYHFEAETTTGHHKIISGSRLDAVEGEDDKDYLELIIGSESTTGDNFKKGIIYHIFVDRFCRVGKVESRDGLELVDNWLEGVSYEYDPVTGERVNRKCYGGNFEGIISKLDYLKDLGTTMIYLSPIFEASSSHKYNTGDYSKIEPMFGGEVAFKKLIREAKKRGIEIILDGVFNHTGSDSVYFNKYSRYDCVGAYQSKKSKYYSWYDFEEYPDKYSSWWGVKSLPETREDSTFPEYIAGKNGIIEKYMDMGVSGFRLDVADELSDEFLYKIHNAIKGKKSDALIVGEVWEDAASKISYDTRRKYFIGSSLDSVTNYPMKNAIIDYVKGGNVDNIVSTINIIKSEYPKSIQRNLMNILDSHDTMRIMTKLTTSDSMGEIKRHLISEEEWQSGIELLKIATILQYTTFGVPTVYYGDEAGMTGGGDPFCRETYPWSGERKDILDWYKKIKELRLRPAIYDGDLNILHASDGVLVYERVSPEDRVIIAINRGEDTYTLTFGEDMLDLLTGNKYHKGVELSRDSFLILSNKETDNFITANNIKPENANNVEKTKKANKTKKSTSSKCVRPQKDNSKVGTKK